MKQILKKIGNIEGIKLKSVNIGIGNANMLSLNIEKEEDYIKWAYFLEKLEQRGERIQIKKSWPELTFVFPNNRTNLERALKAFNQALDKKYYLISKPAQKGITLITKVTNCCNIDCQYCYDRPFREKLGHNGIIDMEKIDHLMDMASRYAEEVTIVCHGGEPTLAGPKFYKKLCDEVLSKYPYAEYYIDLQTNGTLLNEEWFELSKKYNIGIGSSYQATQEDLRETRKSNKLGEKGHTIYNVLDNLKKAQKCDLDIGVIDVMTKENHPRIKEIYEFYKAIGINAVFNEINDSGEAEKHDFLFVSDEDKKLYEEINTDYFTYWANDRSEKMFIDRYASEYMQIILTGSGTVCHNGGGCIGHWVGINSNGDIYPCDRPLGSKYRIGNVMQFENFGEIYNSPKYKRYKAEREQKLNGCKRCNIYDYCGGNCPMIDIDEHGTAAKRNVYACQIKRLNLICAYKALLNTDINKCNRALRNYLITNCLFLPKEIPGLLTELGIADKFRDYNFDLESANFSSKEFKLFATINSPHEKMKIGDGFSVMEKLDLEEVCYDNRLERAKELIRERARKLENKIREEKACSGE